MSQYKVFQWWQGLPGWAKGAIAIGGLVSSWVVYSRIRNSINKGKSLAGAKQEVDSASNDLAALAKRGINPSFPDTQYDTWASELQSQYNGCDVTLQSGIQTGKILKLLKNDADWLMLVKAWGPSRPVKGCLFGSNFTGSLSQAIIWETLAVTRDALNMQLKANGITYRV